MSETINRRSFIAQSAAVALTAGMAATPAEAQTTSTAQRNGQQRIKKSLIYGMLPKEMSREDRFKLARDVGFAGVEVAPVYDMAEAEAMRKAADAAGIHIHSCIYGGWHAPLSSADSAVIDKALKEIEAAMRGLKVMGGDALLLVPAVVNEKTRYADAYRRSQENVHKLIPVARDLKVKILIEEVWNNFLLSPLEFARYVDEFKSPWVQAYFDVGNVVTFGWPEDWIRTLGKRIHRLHFKDYKGGPGLFGGNKGGFVNLLDGSVNWPEVMRAIGEIGFEGYATLELGGGDEPYLRDLNTRFDKILAGS